MRYFVAAMTELTGLLHPQECGVPCEALAALAEAEAVRVAQQRAPLAPRHAQRDRQQAWMTRYAADDTLGTTMARIGDDTTDGIVGWQIGWQFGWHFGDRSVDGTT